MNEPREKTCESCGGSGQISYFKGVSRFLLSTEECPECAGLGRIIPTAEDNMQQEEMKAQATASAPPKNNPD